MGLAVRQGHLAEGCSLAIVNFGGAGVVQRRGPRSWNRALKSDLESLSLRAGSWWFGARPSAWLGFGSWAIRSWGPWQSCSGTNLGLGRCKSRRSWAFLVTWVSRSNF
ncbi:unnamed protein product [Prunus armeniaca]